MTLALSWSGGKDGGGWSGRRPRRWDCRWSRSGSPPSARTRSTRIGWPRRWSHRPWPRSRRSPSPTSSSRRSAPTARSGSAASAAAPPSRSGAGRPARWPASSSLPASAPTLVCVDPSQLDPAFAGRRFDHDLLRDLPAGADPCGENGEFHTFVFTDLIAAQEVRRAE